MTAYQSVVMGVIAAVIVISGAWLGSLLIRRDRTGLAIGLFLVAALFAGTITDNLR